uniref:Thioredoxin domain-containing protein n=1 Tax=Oryza nivara TaxID=4536 RepID=A0A0E0HXF1_ORYNI
MASKRWLRIAILLVPFLHITAIALFAASSKRHHNAIDLKTTYVLLCLTAALDILAEFIRQLLFKLMSMANVPTLCVCETVPQYNNLIRSALHRMAQPAGVLLKCAAHVGYKDGFFVCQRRNLYHMLAGLIFSNLVEVNARGLDLTSYRSFAPGSRNWVLNENLRKACGEEVQDSLRGSFDRSVILWHIATDRRMKTDNRIDDIHRKFLEFTQAISDYMAHLLNLRPDMLMTGSRQHLFTQAMEEVELILKDIESQQQPHSLQMLKQDMLAEKIIDKARAKVNPSIDDKHAPKYPLVHDACKLAEELFDKMDRITRGYLHAKRLGEGGEFLSFVWLILSLKGAKTLADKLQMPEPEPKSEPSFPDQGEPTATVASTNDDGEDLSFLFAGHNKVVLVFMAPWTEPWKLMKPAVERMASGLKSEEAEVGMLNVDRFKILGRLLRVEALPTFVLVKKRRAVARVVGVNREDLQSSINKHLTPSSSR